MVAIWASYIDSICEMPFEAIGTEHNMFKLVSMFRNRKEFDRIELRMVNSNLPFYKWDASGESRTK